MTFEIQPVVKMTPAVLEANFGEMKAALTEELKKYDIVVTAETLGDAKKLCTELNKTTKAIATVRKEQAALAGEPVRIFEENMKEFELEVQAARTKIKTQVERFEDEVKVKIAEMLNDKINAGWEHYQVQPEFRQSKVTDLIKLSHLTATGNLAKAAVTAINERCLNDKALQDRTERRLLELEKDCYKAGLKVSLERVHVERFLFASDEDYAAHLDRLIKVEVIRQHQVETDTRAQVEQEQQAHAQPAAPAQEPEPEPQPESVQNQEPVAEGMKRVRVKINLELDVPAATTNMKLSNAVRQKLDAAGFQSVAGIVVETI